MRKRSHNPANGSPCNGYELPVVEFQLLKFTRRVAGYRARNERKMSEHGITPEQWLAEQRFHAALPLLAEGELSVKRVAIDPGYKQCSHFSVSSRR